MYRDSPRRAKISLVGNPRSQSGQSNQAKRHMPVHSAPTPSRHNPTGGTKSKHDAAESKSEEAHREKERAKEKLNESKRGYRQPVNTLG